METVISFKSKAKTQTNSVHLPRTHRLMQRRQKNRHSNSGGKWGKNKDVCRKSIEIEVGKRVSLT